MLTKNRLIGSRQIVLVAAIACTCPVVSTLATNEVPLTTEITFNADGLKRNGSRLDGKYDIQIQLFDSPIDGNAIGEAYLIENIRIRNGKLRDKRVDFGLRALNGTERWAEVRVRPHDGDGNLRAVDRRVRLHTAPHALALPGLYTLPNETSPGIVGGFFGNRQLGDPVGAVIAGGGRSGGPNFALGDFAVVSGGSSNSASRYASVLGGEVNSASGEYATVLGGFGNSALGGYSLAAGHAATAQHPGAFIFNCDSQGTISSTGPNQFIVRARGGMGINTSDPAATLDVYARADHPSSVGLFINVAAGDRWLQHWHNRTIQQTGGMYIGNSGRIGFDNDINSPGYAVLDSNGAWSQSSDRRLKEDIQPAGDLLERTMMLQPVSYRWKGRQDQSADIGFIAQEVRAVFPSLVKGDEESYYTLDYAGLSVAAIGSVQALKHSNDALVQENELLCTRIDAMSRTIEKLKDDARSIERMQAQLIELEARVVALSCD